MKKRKRETHFRKNHFSKLFLNYFWTFSSIKEVCRQPFQRPGYNHSKKKKKKNFFSKTQNQDISLCEFRLGVSVLGISSIFYASMSKLGALAQNIFIIIEN